MLGPGVYASRDINKTLAYGNEWGRRVVLKLLVFTGKVKKIMQQGDPRQYSWHGEFDTAWVPPGCGECICYRLDFVNFRQDSGFKFTELQ